jgi:hypothetical protein
VRISVGPSVFVEFLKLSVIEEESEPAKYTLYMGANVQKLLPSKTEDVRVNQ